MTTWRSLIREEMDYHAESLDDVVASTMGGEGLDKPFTAASASEIKGEPFTLWTLRRVYFPVNYDGMESVSSVSRGPDGVPTPHIGGGW